MEKKTKRFLTSLPRRIGALLLSAVMVVGSVYDGGMTASAAAVTSNSWKADVLAALENLSNAQQGAENYDSAVADVQAAYDGLVGAKSVENLSVIAVTEDSITLEWSTFADNTLVGYNVYWSDTDTETSFQLLDKNGETVYDADIMTIDASTLDAGKETVTFVVNNMSTYKNIWFKVAPVTTVGVGSKSAAVMSPTTVAYEAQLENIGRGLTVTQVSNGAFLNWRLFASDLDGGYTETGLTGYDFNVYRNGEKIATVVDSTNYLDKEFTGTLAADTYKIVPVDGEVELTDLVCDSADVFTADSANTDVAYFDIPLQKPADTTFKETYGVDTLALGGYTMTDSGYTTADAVITYSANDMSVGDVDGDGEYEYFVKWDPSWSKDVSQQGYTGKAYIDCYELDGTLLWRLDLGINIRAGAHYTEFGVYDYDGDDMAEMMVKTAPGTKMIKYALDENGKNIVEGGALKVASEDYVTHTASGIAQGATDTSDYVFSAADYREYLIDVFMDWGVWSRYSEKTVADAIDGHWSDNLVTMFSTSANWSDATFYAGEVASSANVTKNMGSMTTADIQAYLPEYQEGDTLVNVALYDESGKLRYVSSSSGVNPVLKTVRVQDVAQYMGNYDLASVNKDVKGVGYTEAEATILADYYLNHYQYRMKKHNLNTFEGYIVTGPEYITLFAGDGTELDTQDWYYGREDDGLLWGDHAMNYIEPGNRVDRYNVAVAYLDGETPSCIMGRGYYTRTTMVAYNVVDKKLQVAGAIDSGWTVMSNPFNDGPHGYDGCDPVNGSLSGEGDHYIAVADVDGDGRQDIVNGGAIVSYKNGELYLYSAGGDYLNGGDPTKAWAKYGHGDAIHITDINPDNPGLEIASCFEGAAWAPYNWAVRDAKTNKVLFGAPGTSDYGRLTIGDVLPDVPGLEIDAGYDAKGNKVTLVGVSNNMNIKWAADMTTKFVSGTTNTTIIGNDGGKSKTYVNASGYSTNNSTKGNPSLVADIFGDYREEIILRKADSSSLRIYMNTEVSGHKNYTLMHNMQYRVGIASQNSSYNQPAYTDYYYAADTDWSKVKVQNTEADQNPGKVVVNPTSVKLNETVKTILPGETLQLSATVMPAAADQTVVWASDNEAVTVDANGLVTAVSNGTANVTATTANNIVGTAVITVVGAYSNADTDKMAIGAVKTFSFGSNAVEGATQITAESAYSAEAGYGFAAADKIALANGADYVSGTNYRSTDATPVYQYPTFEVDVPVGVYKVTIVQGTNGTDAAVNGAYVEGNKYSVRWAEDAFSTAFIEPVESSWIWTKAGETKTSEVTTAVADGKLTINFATSLTDEGVSGTTYIKEVKIERMEQIITPSTNPTLRFIGDSTLAKYPPEDGGNWTPIPERKGWGEDFSMGLFVDEDVTLVNKAVAGSSVKSYIYDGYLNDFLLNSHPGDTVIIEGGINDSAAGPRYSTADEFKTTLAYIIDCCEAFGLDVILSSGTSSSTTYTTPMIALAEERELYYVNLLDQWAAYQTKAGTTQGNMTVDGTHLRRVGSIVAAQLVANSIADLGGYYISGHINKTPVNYEKPTAVVTGLYASAQTENSVTLSWNLDDATIYAPDQLVTDFNIYCKATGASSYTKVGTQTAYVSAGMDGVKLSATIPSTGGSYYVTCVGLTGEGEASAAVTVKAYVADARYTINDLAKKYLTQHYDASTYSIESYVAVLTALTAAQDVVADAAATDADVEAALAAVNTAIEGLTPRATTLIKTDFQDEALVTAPWGVGGNQKGLMAAEIEEDGNRLLNLYVEAAGSRYVNKAFEGAASVNAANEVIAFRWYPGNPDNRNVTEVEFYSSDANRVLSLKTSCNGHIGYVVGNYPTDSTAYMTGDGFHTYEGSKAVDLKLSNEQWYDVKVILDYAAQEAALIFVDEAGEKTVVDSIKIDTAGSNTITKLNWLLMRGKAGTAGTEGTSNDLSILWDSYYDDYAMYYTTAASDVTQADLDAYAEAVAAYAEATEGLSEAVLSTEQFVLAQNALYASLYDVGFFTAADYQYVTTVLENAVKNAPAANPITSVEVKADETSVTAGLTVNVTAETNANVTEDLIWTTSDADVAEVSAVGIKAVVTAKKAGTVTITASNTDGTVKDSVELTVTGTAYFFNEDTDVAYSEEAGYGFADYTYYKEAAGFTEGISPDGNAYIGRELNVNKEAASYVNMAASSADYVAVNGQYWTELPEGGRDEDKIPYQNTSAFVAAMANGNYEVSVTFCNPGLTATTAQVLAENIVRYSAGDHGAAELASATIPAGSSTTVTFPIALTDGELTLRFVQNLVADSEFAAAANRTVYVKSVSVDKYEVADRDKTAILIAGDSTVQSYADKSYRTSWAQLLYKLFAADEASAQVNDGTNTGFATYETEDVYIANYARDARSTKSFMEEGRLNNLLLNVQEGDYVFMQFAHNDDNVARVNRFVSLDDFAANIQMYNKAVAERGGTLVLVTPIALGVWTEGVQDHRFDDYRLVMLESGLPVLDLMGSTLGLLADMGETNCNTLKLYKDTVHTFEIGATIFQSLMGNLLTMTADTKLDAVQALMNVAATTEGVSISESSVAMGLESTQKLTVATTAEKVTYLTSDEEIVKVSADGTLTSGKKEGTAIVTVSYTTGDLTTGECTGYSDYVVVTVKAAEVASAEVVTGFANYACSEANLEVISGTISRKSEDAAPKAFNQDAWNALNNATSALKTKIGLFADDSTPFDYDVILVNKMTAALDALAAVKDMPLADTASGDAAMALGEAAYANKELYTESSMAILLEAMAAYEEAVKALNINEAVNDLEAVINYWLQGVETEYDAQPYAGYFDFDSTLKGTNSFNSALLWKTEGWTSVGYAAQPGVTLYTPELGYGITEACNGRNRYGSITTDTMLADFMMGGIFKVDLKAGTYKVAIYSGDINSGCKAVSAYEFYANYVDDTNPGTPLGTIEKQTAAAASYLVRNITITLEEDATVAMVCRVPAGESGTVYTNGVIFEEDMPATVESFDATALNELVTTITTANPVETDYTLSSWAAFETALANAKFVVDANRNMTAQENALYYDALDNAYKGLVKREANGMYQIDFGPADENGAAAQLATNLLLSGYQPTGVTLPATNELMVGTQLYETNVNDNGLHYGFTSEAASGFTATGGAYFRDYVYAMGGVANTFKADLPAGDYMVYVYTGSKEAANTTKFYFGNGEAALAHDGTASATPSEVVDGKTIYTQTSNAGGQFAAPGCIYKVTVAPNSEALSYVNGVSMGTFSLTFFNDAEGLAADELTARLNGICICPIAFNTDAPADTLPPDATATPVPTEAPTEAPTPTPEPIVDESDAYVDFKDVEVFGSYDFGTKVGTPEGWVYTGTTEYNEADGRGYLTAAADITPGKVGVGITLAGETATALETACGDLARAGNELAYAVDVPAGSYRIDVYAGAAYSNSAYNDNKVYVNDKYLGVVTQDTTVDAIKKTAYMTFEEAGQIVVKASNQGQLAILNAMVITTIAEPDYSDWTAESVTGYDFGTKVATPEGWVYTGTTEYSEADGQGYLTAAADITPGKVGVGITPAGETATDIEVACGDLARASNELAYAVDVEAGVYKVDVYAGAAYSNNAYNGCQIYVNDKNLGTVSQSASVADIVMTRYLTFEEAGQIVVKASNQGQLAILNAMVITKLVEGAGVPTEAPTAAPTEAPTEAPTAAPTEAPTEAPTVAPTEAPTAAPTEAPTEAPTAAPTEAPTAAPTEAPTAAPTEAPTQRAQVESFIQRMYLEVLGREADEGGLDYWANSLISNERDGASVAVEFLLSEEFLGNDNTNEEYINILYKAFFDRDADEGGKSYWCGMLENGTDRRTVVVGFVNSQEYFDLCKGYGISRGVLTSEGVAVNTGIYRFAERLYTTILGRESEKEGIEYWSLAIYEQNTTPQQAAMDFLWSPEYLAKNASNEEFVRTLYGAFMDREADEAGLSYWVGQIEAGMERSEVVGGFVWSPEFSEIMAGFGL